MSRALSRIAEDDSVMLSIRSLAASKVSGVEGSCKSSSRISLGRESKGTRLDKPLPGAIVSVLRPWVWHLNGLMWVTLRLSPYTPLFWALASAACPSSSASCVGQGNGINAMPVRCPSVPATRDGVEGL